MIEKTLFWYEWKRSLKLLIIFILVLTMYTTIIIQMYDPKMMETLDNFYKIMPEIMAAVGMTPGSVSLLGFMVSYLYGFIYLIFPMIFTIIKANGLIASYVDKGTMVSLLAAPVSRKKVVLTQLFVLLVNLICLFAYTTILEIILCQSMFPKEFIVKDLIALNACLFSLHLAIAGICFLASCWFNDMRYSLLVGAGIPLLMYIIQMLANVSNNLKNLQYLTIFSLFNGSGILQHEKEAMLGGILLLGLAIILFIGGCIRFCKKDMII